MLCRFVCCRWLAIAFLSCTTQGCCTHWLSPPQWLESFSLYSALMRFFHLDFCQAERGDSLLYTFTLCVCACSTHGSKSHGLCFRGIFFWSHVTALRCLSRSPLALVAGLFIKAKKHQPVFYYSDGGLDVSCQILLVPRPLFLSLSLFTHTQLYISFMLRVPSSLFLRLSYVSCEKSQPGNSSKKELTHIYSATRRRRLGKIFWYSLYNTTIPAGTTTTIIKENATQCAPVPFVVVVAPHLPLFSLLLRHFLFSHFHHMHT